MSRKLWRSLVLFVFLPGLLLAYNNCGKFAVTEGSMGLGSELASGIDGGGESAIGEDLFASKILSGSGVNKNVAAGCAEVSLTDFMETAPATNRRIEPRDRVVVNISTPIFSWPQPLDMSAGANMRLEIRSLTQAGYAVAQNTPVPRALLQTVLPAGTYKWLVRYTNKYGQPKASQERCFSVPSISLLALPSGDTFVATAWKKEHPRILPAGKSFAIVEDLVQKSEYAHSYTGFLSKAAVYVNQPTPSIPPVKTLANFATKAEYDKWAADVVAKAAIEAAAIEVLTHAARLTGNSAYESAAISRAYNLAQWDPNGPTSEANQDQLNRKIFLVLGMTMDLFEKDLNATVLLKLSSTMRNRLQQTVNKFPNFNDVPYNSHLVTATMFIVEALLYAVPTTAFPEADIKKMLSQAWETAITVATVWGNSSDGGFGNGPNYAWAASGNIARFMAAVRIMSGYNLARWPALTKIGDNQIAFNPANLYLMEQMGDGIESNNSYANYSWQEFRLLAAVTARPDYEWYWRVNPKNIMQDVAVAPIHYMLYASMSTPPSAPLVQPTLPNSFVFEDAGMVAFHSNTIDSLRSSVIFRSSRYGSFNHSHADNNSFNFVSKGKEIFISGGYYINYLDPHHAQVTRATRFKNALTFNGGIGQAEPSEDPSGPGAPIVSMDASGKLLNFDDNGTWAIVTGDASKAYRGRGSANGPWVSYLNDAVRSVLYNRKLGLVLIYDYATSSKNRFWELNFQSITRPTKTSNQSIKVVNGVDAGGKEISGCLNIWASDGDFTLTDSTVGFPAQPEKPRPVQYQSRYRVKTATPKFVSVTAIRESCASMQLKVSFSDDGGASISVNGAAPIVAKARTVSLP